MITTVLHQAGGITLAAFEEVCDYVAKVYPVYKEQKEHYRFSKN